MAKGMTPVASSMKAMKQVLRQVRSRRIFGPLHDVGHPELDGVAEG